MLNPSSFRIRIFVGFLGLWISVSAPSILQGAATPDNTVGARLLRAQLPAGSNVGQVNCEHLIRAVRMATLAHHTEAASILTAALTVTDGRSTKAGKRSCQCVVEIFRAAVNAAPDHASELLETAEALCPECADGLAAMLGRLEDKNAVADPKDRASNSGDPGVTNSDPRAPSSSELSDRDYQGIGLTSRDPGTGSDPGTGVGTDGGSGSGFGTGTGSGTGSGTSSGNGGSDSFFGGFGGGLGVSFPGSPNFGGSSPGGGFALPGPVSPPVTSVVNG